MLWGIRGKTVIYRLLDARLLYPFKRYLSRKYFCAEIGIQSRKQIVILVDYPHVFIFSYHLIRLLRYPLSQIS